MIFLQFAKIFQKGIDKGKTSAIIKVRGGKFFKNKKYLKGRYRPMGSVIECIENRLFKAKLF